MKTRTKALLLALCAVLLVCSTILGTLAYLTSTDEVKNTFTVGQVTITMDETKVNKDGTAVANAARVKANQYHLLPGHTYTKDPTIHVDADSENCYIYVKVENQIAAIEAPTSTEDPAYTSIADQMKANGWVLVDGTTNIYAYNAIAKAGENHVVFENFKIKGEVANDELGKYAPKTTTVDGKEVTDYTNILVTAYAVQADGFNTAADAWAAANFGA